MNKLFTSLLIIALFSQSISASSTPKRAIPTKIETAQENFLSELTACVSTDCAADKTNCNNDKLAAAFNCMISACVNDASFADKTNYYDNLAVCKEKNLDSSSDCGKKFSEIQLDGLSSCASSSKILAVFGLVLSLFLMI